MGLIGIPDILFGPLGPLAIPAVLIIGGYLIFKLLDLGRF
jgi:hypothetical protein